MPVTIIGAHYTVQTTRFISACHPPASFISLPHAQCPHYKAKPRVQSSLRKRAMDRLKNRGRPDSHMVTASGIMHAVARSPIHRQITPVDDGKVCPLPAAVHKLAVRIRTVTTSKCISGHRRQGMSADRTDWLSLLAGLQIRDSRQPVSAASADVGGASASGVSARRPVPTPGNLSA
jgi:hypothetical protein